MYGMDHQGRAVELNPKSNPQRYDVERSSVPLSEINFYNKLL